MRLFWFWSEATLAVLLCVFFSSANAEILVIDDSGHRVILSAPAQRIVSLVPHTTELLSDAGAGKKIISVYSGSDYPAQVLQLPSAGVSVRTD